MINRTTWIVTGAIGVLGFGAGTALAAGPFSIPGADSARVTDAAPVSVGTNQARLHADPLPARPAVRAIPAVPAVRAVPAVPGRHAVPAQHAIPAVPARHAVPAPRPVPVHHAAPMPVPVPVHHAEPAQHSEYHH